MSKLVIYEERCKSCGYCVHSCPRQALSFSDRINEKGYPAVQVDRTRCITRGICYNVCPDYVFEIHEEEVIS